MSYTDEYNQMSAPEREINPISPEAIKYAKNRGWWDIEDDTPPTPPSIGNTKRDIYEAWRKLGTFHYGRLVVGFVPAVGSFSLGYDGKISKHIPKNNRGMSTVEIASSDDLEEIDRAVDNGTFQVEARPITGVADTTGYREEGTVIYHQATGRKLKHNDRPSD